MQFATRKRRHPPTIIIVSLIDVLIVVLIFLMVTSTFKQQPSVKLTLPESNQSRASGAAEGLLVVTIPKEGPIHLGTEPVTFDRLKEKFVEAARKNPETRVSIRGDTDAHWGQVIRVMDIAKAANVRNVSAAVKSSGD